MKLLDFLSNPLGLFKPLVFGTVGAKSPRFLRWSYPLLLAALLLAVWISGAQAAEDFLAPANEGLTSLRTQIVGIAGAIFGLGIVAYGVWSAMIQRILWEKLWVFILAALLVTVGPAGISYMFDTFGK
jgi:type IV secretion system protein VirB2